MITSTPGVGHNDPVTALLLQVHELGAAKARGVDTLVQFGLLVANAAYDGKLDLVKHKHGNTIDDAVKFYAEFEKGRSKASIFDHTSASGKVQAAKLRTMIKLGGSTRFHTGEPIGTINKLMDIRRKLRMDPLMRSKLDDAYATLLRYARFQMKPDQPLVDDPEVLRAFCFKSTGEPITRHQWLATTAKRLDDLRAGKAAGGTLRKYSSPDILTALSALRAACADAEDDDE